MPGNIKLILQQLYVLDIKIEVNGSKRDRNIENLKSNATFSRSNLHKCVLIAYKCMLSFYTIKLSSNSIILVY